MALVDAEQEKELASEQMEFFTEKRFPRLVRGWGASGPGGAEPDLQCS